MFIFVLLVRKKWNIILKDCIEVEEKEKKVVLCSRSPQNVKLDTFRS